MFKRIRQVILALTAKITIYDRDFVSKWLNQPEQTLFWSMNLPDQQHAINVAYTAQKLVRQRKIKIDQINLIKSCLLHDIGKVKGDVSTIDKILLVVCYQFMPGWARQWQKAGKGNIVQNFRHALYIYEYHPQIGAEKLRQIGRADLADIIVKHHQLAKSTDQLELVLLRDADELN